MLRSILGCVQFISCSYPNNLFGATERYELAFFNGTSCLSERVLRHISHLAECENPYAVLQKTLPLFRFWYAHYTFQCFVCSFCDKAGGLGKRHSLVLEVTAISVTSHKRCYIYQSQYTRIFIFYVNFLRTLYDGALTPVCYSCSNPKRQTKKKKSTPYYPSKQFTISKAQTLNKISTSRTLLLIHLQSYVRFQRHLHFPLEVRTYKTCAMHIKHAQCI
jgi:hypothetical protein